MKRLITFLIAITLIIVSAIMIGCDNNKSPKNPFEPPANQPAEPNVWTPFVPQAELSLMKVGQDGELPKISVGEDINFGEIFATKKLNYIVMNTGNLDLFDIEFTANKTEVFPNTIGVLKLMEGGLSTSPILSLTVPHVLPVSGVGSLLDMELGELNDTLTLSYKYQVIPFEHTVLDANRIISLMDSIVATSDSTTDTLWVYGDTLNVAEIEKDTITNLLRYSIGGTKMGVVIDILPSGKNILSEMIESYYNDLQGNPVLETFYEHGNQRMDTIIVTNNGNSPFNLNILNTLLMTRYSQATLDTIIQPNETIDIGKYLLSVYEEIPDSLTWDEVKHYISCESSKCIIKLNNSYYFNGKVTLKIKVDYDNE